jgi:hypothetical protein
MVIPSSLCLNFVFGIILPYTMKCRATIVAVSVLVLYVSYPENLSAQDDFKSDVYKEFDEDGNITRFDSCWSWSFRGGPGFSFDSVFSRLFSDHWTDTGFHAGHFPMFPDHFFRGFPFPDYEEIFMDHMERMSEFFHHFHFPMDTIPYFQPWEDAQPGDHDPPPGGIESRSRIPRSFAAG